MSQQFKVIFYLRSGYRNKDNKISILTRISLNGNRLQLSATGFTVNEEFWDNKSCRVTGKTADSRKINSELDRIESDLIHIFRRHEFSENLSLDLIKSEYLGGSVNYESFLKFWNEFMGIIKQEVNKTRSQASYQKFNVLRKHFTNYLKTAYNRNDVLFSELNYKIVSGFYHYLITTGKCCNNTAMKMMGFFKSIIIRAIRLGHIKQDPFVGFKMKFDKVDRGYLTDDEINILISKKFSIKRLEQVRDIFIFSCFTGLAYIDVKNLTEDNIVEMNSRKWIMTKRQKTDVETNILLLDIPFQIINKYIESSGDKHLLPVLSNQKLNSYLKEIADICGINKRLTFHMARHTFATMSLTNGVSMEAVSKMLGHTNIKTTQIYARIVNKKIESEMLGLSEKLKKFKS